MWAVLSVNVGGSGSLVVVAVVVEVVVVVVWWSYGRVVVVVVGVVVLNAHRLTRYLKAARAAVAGHLVQINFESLQLSVEEEWTHVIHVASHIVIV